MGPVPGEAGEFQRVIRSAESAVVPAQEHLKARVLITRLKARVQLDLAGLPCPDGNPRLRDTGDERPPAALCHPDPSRMPPDVRPLRVPIELSLGVHHVQVPRLTGPPV